MPRDLPATDPNDAEAPPLPAKVRADLEQRLEAVYAQVPGTCCAGSGECCVLTEEEMHQGYATMFPLYLAEYLRIAEHVRKEEPPSRATRLLGTTEERPRQCPFLGPDRGCTIYGVRPLICRTYAVLDPQTIAAAAGQYRDEVPREWTEGFARREAAMHCPRVTVTQPDKLVQHIHHLITHTYERTLVRLSRGVFGDLPAPRRKLVREKIRQRSWPTRWTWGGFNALRQTPAAWVQAHLESYWKRAQLNDLG